MSRPSPRHSDGPIEDEEGQVSASDVPMDPDVKPDATPLLPAAIGMIPNATVSVLSTPEVKGPQKAVYAAVTAFFTSALGVIVAGRIAGADFDVDLILAAIYTALTGGGITGAVTYVKPNKDN